MHTILGAGGSIGNELARELVRRGKQVRLVGRNPRNTDGSAEAVSADLSDPDRTIRAVSGSSVVYLLVGLKYDLRVWRALWPRVMQNSIEACKRANARLIFFDNVYMYGHVNGAMTEQTPYNPCSKKGEIRAQIATSLLEEAQAGNLVALIARSADFYGPGAKNSVPNLLVFDKLSSGSKALWLASDSAKHSLTFTPDAARSLALLADSETAWNQVWHVPTSGNPPTGTEFIRMVAGEFGVPPRYRLLRRPMVRMAGWFDRTIHETYEMLYQSEYDYVFDSAKFEKAFKFQPTPYAEGIRITAGTYGKRPHGVA